MTSTNFKEFLHVRSASSPHSPKPCLLTDKNFANNFFKVSPPRNILVKLLQNLSSGFREEDYLRISSCHYSASSPHSPEPCLLTDHNFVNNF